MHAEKAIKRWKIHFKKYHTVKKKKCIFEGCDYMGIPEEMPAHLSIHPKKCTICGEEVLRGKYRKIVKKEGDKNKIEHRYETFQKHRNQCRNKNRPPLKDRVRTVAKTQKIKI